MSDKPKQDPVLPPKAALKPPRKGVDTFTLSREPFTDILMIALPDGATYYTELEELKQWLRIVQVPELRVIQLCDVLWNFPRLTYTVSTDNLKVH